MATDRCDFAIGNTNAYYYFCILNFVFYHGGLDDFFDEQLALVMAQNTPYLTTINEE